jgi:uncharacterized protein
MRRITALFVLAFFAQASLAYGAEITISPLGSKGRMSTSVESLLEQRWKNVVRQQFDISCGSAALATILQYHFGDQVKEDAVIRNILQQVKQDVVRKRGGFSLLDLKRVAASLKYNVKGFKLSLDQLAKLNRPAVVPLTIRGYNHFVVFRGKIGTRVVVADPSFGNTIMTDFDFNRLWQGVALVLVKDTEEDLPAKLNIMVGDLMLADPDGALRSINPRTITGVNPDEF